MTGADVAAEARTWLDTPFLHQARVKGVGCDCAGLVGGVAVALGILPRDFWATLPATFAGYARTPYAGLLELACDTYMTRIHPKHAEAGDVVGMVFAEEPQHLAILVDHPQGLGIVHALMRNRKVVEHRLDDGWRARVTCAWRMI